MKTRKTFTESALPDIRTGFVLRDGGMSVFHDTVYDFDNDRDDINLNIGEEEILDSYPLFIPCRFRNESETWYIAPQGIDFVALFPDNPDIAADMVLSFDAYKAENNFELAELPLHLYGHRDFLRLDIASIRAEPQPYLNGTYIFNKTKLAALLQDRDWTSHYVFAERGHQQILRKRLDAELSPSLNDEGWAP